MEDDMYWKLGALVGHMLDDNELFVVYNESDGYQFKSKDYRYPVDKTKHEYLVAPPPFTLGESDEMEALYYA